MAQILNAKSPNIIPIRKYNKRRNSFEMILILIKI